MDDKQRQEMNRVLSHQLAKTPMPHQRVKEWSPGASAGGMMRISEGIYTWMDKPSVITDQRTRADALFKQLTELGQEYEAVMAENRRLRQRIRDLEPTAKPITNYRWGRPV